MTGPEHAPSTTAAESPLQVAWWQDRLYPSAESRDPVLRFFATVEGRIAPSARVLDIGAGAGERNPYDFRGRCREMVGVDLDPRVAENPLLDRGMVADASRLPFEDASFDLAFSVYVLEHVADPAAFAREVYRVLRPGGTFLALTPNRWHYVAALSALTPHRFHEWVNRRRGRAEGDTFPTHYRLNDRRALHDAFGAAGFAAIDVRAIEVQPNYLLFNVPAFLAGAAYERVVNASDRLAALRVNLIVECRRPRLS
jgi:SAM-dependent methyltransferase